MSSALPTGQDMEDFLERVTSAQAHIDAVPDRPMADVRGPVLSLQQTIYDALWSAGIPRVILTLENSTSLEIAVLPRRRWRGYTGQMLITADSRWITVDADAPDHAFITWARQSRAILRGVADAIEEQARAHAQTYADAVAAADAVHRTLTDTLLLHGYARAPD